MRYKMVMSDVNGEVFTVGYNNSYREICVAAERLSVMIKHKSVKVYSYSTKYQIWNEEAYYLNGK